MKDIFNYPKYKWHPPVTKVKSQNLLGESMKEEESRLNKEKIKAILKGKDKLIVREIKRGGKGYLAGTTKYQRKVREKIRKNAGII